jgi:two-component system, sensor histidine kinase
MKNTLPLFNWSLKKVLDAEPDSFIKARIRIIFTIISLSLLKSVLVIVIGAANEEWRQVARAVIAFSAYTLLLKILLYNPSRLKLITHILLVIGIAVIWSNIFLYAHKINLPTIQFVFMVALSSFYILGSRLGILYSVFGMFPVMLFLIFRSSFELNGVSDTHELGSPGYEIVVILNFITILVAHYLFYKAINLNISEKEKLNRQLQISIAEANNLAASRSHFLSTMSHELRTPLNSVVGLSELLLLNNPADHQKDDLRILQLSALDLLSLINNVLDFNKIDSERLTLEKITFHLPDFIRNICDVLGVKAVNKQLNFVLNIDEQLEHTHVVSDPTRLSQVIYNLVGNAIKFTEKGSVIIKLDLINKTEQTVDVMFSVQDTGIGISPDEHESIFEIFSQAESSTIRKYGGTGLGLAIVKQILTLFDTQIQVESMEGSGTRFFFTLSLATTSHGAEISMLNELPHEQDLSHLRILVAEDDEINRLVIRKQLDTLGITPLIVENGVLAYEAYQSWDFDVVLLDLHMPVAGGYDTIKRIRALSSPSKANVQVIAFTASVTEEQNIHSAGFNDFLYKPTNLEDLRNKLEKVAVNIDKKKE